MLIRVEQGRGLWIARYDDGECGYSVVEDNPIRAYLVLLCILEDEGVYEPSYYNE